MPPPTLSASQPNSLWQGGSSFFRDPRAAKIGDLITVQIDIGDQAKIANTTTRPTNASATANATNPPGLARNLTATPPNAVHPPSPSARTGTVQTLLVSPRDNTVSAVPSPYIKSNFVNKHIGTIPKGAEKTILIKTCSYPQNRPQFGFAKKIEFGKNMCNQ